MALNLGLCVVISLAMVSLLTLLLSALILSDKLDIQMMPQLAVVAALISAFTGALFLVIRQKGRSLMMGLLGGVSFFIVSMFIGMAIDNSSMFGESTWTLLAAEVGGGCLAGLVRLAAGSRRTGKRRKSGRRL